VLRISQNVWSHYTTLRSLRAPVHPSSDYDAATSEAGIAHHVIVDCSISTVQLRNKEIQEEDLSEK